MHIYIFPKLKGEIIKFYVALCTAAGIILFWYTFIPGIYRRASRGRYTSTLFPVKTKGLCDQWRSVYCIRNCDNSWNCYYHYYYYKRHPCRKTIGDFASVSTGACLKVKNTVGNSETFVWNVKGKYLIFSEIWCEMFQNRKAIWAK